MNAVDPRTRSKVILEPNVKGRTSVALSQLLVSNFVYVLALGLAREYLLFSESNVLWVTQKVLAVGCAVVVFGSFAAGQWRRKTVEWAVVGFASFLLSLRLATLCVALSRMSAARVAIITHFSSLWVKSILDTSNRRPALLICAGVLFSLLSDASFSAENLWEVAPAYVAIVIEALSSSILEHTQGVLLPSLGPSVTNALTIAGACVMTTGFHGVSLVLLGQSSTSPGFLESAIFIVLLAYSLLQLSPTLTKQLSSSPAKGDVTLSFITMSVSFTVLGLLVLSRRLGISDMITASLLCYGIILSKERNSSRSPYSSISQLARSYLKSILENPESRKIFYFLVLNMCYMLVQMLYGVWTNSLGLISDAIHMAFDCMAIGVGLVASVMARWQPNERFTYGYGRIETLSGFSNGIFLILISIFIVFEAIERLMNPPEMNTSQLLLVSTLGLCVNLFGMFAMGGHHHHGGHSHSHGHSHAPSPKPKAAQEESHGHSHAHGHGHGEHALRIDTQAAPQQDHSHSHTDHTAHAHSHSHDHSHSRVEDSTSHLARSHSHAQHPHLHTDGNQSPDANHSHSHSHSDHANHSESCGHSDAHDRDHHSCSLDDPISSGSERDSETLHLLPSPNLDFKSPLTPSYRFGHDQHFEEHHAHTPGPNLHDHAHAHEHGHEGHSHNMRGVFLHVMADTLGSVGVIISTLLIQFYGWTGFDPIASLFIAILIAASVIPLVIDTGKVLMLDLSSRSTNIENTLASLHHVEGLDSFSSARFWPKDDNTVIGSIHLHISASSSSFDPGGPHSTIQGKYTKVDRVVERVDTILRNGISGLDELTIQVEGALIDSHL